VPSDFLRRGLAALEAGTRAVIPYREVLYLTAAASEAVLARRLAEPSTSLDPAGLPGRRFSNSNGGVIWVETGLYREIGGYDERVRGWGYEDREFFQRIERINRIERLPETLLHLDHARPAEHGAGVEANRRLCESLCRSRPSSVANPAAMGNPRLYVA